MVRDRVDIDSSGRINERLDGLIDQLQAFPELYRHRLIVVVQGITDDDRFSLNHFARGHDLQYININLELSRRLLEVPQQQWPTKVFRLLSDEIVGRSSASAVALEHIEVLFDPALQVNPVDCLLQLARYRLVIARWKGTCDDRHLVYAEPGHPEFCQHPTEDIQVLSLE